MTTASQQDPIVIVGQARTPMGGFMGDLASVKATELGSTAIRAAVARARGHTVTGCSESTSIARMHFNARSIAAARGSNRVGSG